MHLVCLLAVIVLAGNEWLIALPFKEGESDRHTEEMNREWEREMDRERKREYSSLNYMSSGYGKKN